MTEDERKNRNPAPEMMRFDAAGLKELNLSDLVVHHVYVLHQVKYAATLNYMGTVVDPADGAVAYHFHAHAPRLPLDVFLRARPSGDGTLEDGRGVKVTIYAYEGPDA